MYYNTKKMEYKGVKIDWLHHNCFRISGKNKIVYTDPYKLNKDYNDADIILITHDHYDHLDIESIKKLLSNGTVIVAPKDCGDPLSKITAKKILVSPHEVKIVDGVTIKTVPAYNLNKFRTKNEVFHPKAKGNVGYVFIVDEVRLYTAGDTDFTEEMKKVRVDVAMLPVSGIYVMTAEEASEAAKAINAEITIPAHYGFGIGTQEDAERFKKLAGSKLKVELLRPID